MEEIDPPLPQSTAIIIRGVKRSALPIALDNAVGAQGSETRLYFFRLVRSLARVDAKRDLYKQRAANDNDPRRNLRSV